MKNIIFILKYKSIGYLRTITDFSAINVIKSAGTSLVYFGFATGVFVFTLELLEYLMERAHLGNYLFHEFLSYILFIFFLSVNVGNIIVSFATLYNSKEIYFFMTKPVNPESIFLIKFADNFFYSSSTLIMVLLSAFLAYTIYFKLSVIGFLTILFLNLMPMIITAGSIGVIILLIVMKAASKAGLKNVLIVLILIYLTAVLLYFNLTSPVSAVEEVMKYYPNIDKYFASLKPGLFVWLPNQWLSSSLYWHSISSGQSGLIYYIYQISAAIFFFSVAILLGRKWYYITWISDYRKNSTDRKLLINVFSFFKKSRFDIFSESLYKKEFHLFFREPIQFIHFSFLFLLIIAFVASISKVKFVISSNQELQPILYIIVFLFNVLLISSLALRFVFPLISLEGNAIWKILSAPVNLRRYVFTKMKPYMISLLFISFLLSVFSNLNYGYYLMSVYTVISLISSVAIIMLNFSLGALFKNYNEKNAIRLASSQGASITFLFNIFYMLFLVILFYPFTEKYFINSSQGYPIHHGDLFLPFFIFSLFSGLIIIVSFNIAHKYIQPE